MVTSIQEELYRRYCDQRMLRNMAAEIEHAAPGTFSNAQKYIGSVGKSAANAEPFFVAAHIADLLVPASATLPSCVLTNDLLPVQHGFMYFEHPYPLPQLGDGEQDHNLLAIAWEHINSEIAQGYAGDIIFLSGWTGTSTPLLMSVETWTLGEAWDQVVHETQVIIERDYELPNGVEKNAVIISWQTAVRKAFMTALTFMAQELAAVTHAPAERSFRKRAARDGHRPPPEIRVIHLRRTERPSVDPDLQPHEKHVAWAVRWKVREHWRNQWYRSLGRHHPKFIDSYWKGPEDAPPKLTKNVYAVTR